MPLISISLLEKISYDHAAVTAPYQETKLPSPLWKSRMPDHAQCYTSFSPRAREEMSLDALIVSGMEGPDAGPDYPGWKLVVFEDIADPEFRKTAKQRGYRDEKYSVYGNDLSKALQLKLELRRKGTITLCEPPGVWGQYPDGFSHLWSDEDVNIKIESKGRKGGLFGLGRSAGAHSFLSTHDHESVCIISKEAYEAGTYTISIQARGEKNIILATVITP